MKKKTTKKTTKKATKKTAGRKVPPKKPAAKRASTKKAATKKTTTKASRKATKKSPAKKSATKAEAPKKRRGRSPLKPLVCQMCGSENLVAVLAVKKFIPLSKHGNTIAVAGEKVTQSDLKNHWELTEEGKKRMIRGPIMCDDCGVEHYYLMGVERKDALRMGSLEVAVSTGYENLMDGDEDDGSGEGEEGEEEGEEEEEEDDESDDDDEESDDDEDDEEEEEEEEEDDD